MKIRHAQNDGAVLIRKDNNLLTLFGAFFVNFPMGQKRLFLTLPMPLWANGQPLLPSTLAGQMGIHTTTQ